MNGTTGSSIAADTFVDSENWDELKAQGLVHCTNVMDYSAYGAFGSQVGDIRAMLQWEVGEANLFEGWCLIDGRPEPPEPPNEFWGPADDCGFYVVPPEEGWMHPWARMIDFDHPSIVEAGIGHLLLPDDSDLHGYMAGSKWDIWTVYGSDDRYRCMRSRNGEGFEGTLHEVIAYIKACEIIEEK